MARFNYILHQPRPTESTLPHTSEKSIEETIFDLVESAHYSSKYSDEKWEYR